MKRALILLVKVYQWTIAPVLPPRCRFIPSCSHYMIEALQTHGAGRGLMLGTRRLLRCQPCCKGGVDPVPPPRRKGHSPSESTPSLDADASPPSA